MALLNQFFSKSDKRAPLFGDTHIFAVSQKYFVEAHADLS